FTDYLDELKPVRVRVAKRLSEGLTIRLTPEVLAELRARAEVMGLGPTTLARMWILERLHEPRSDRRRVASGQPRERALV
ncbi:MAG: hypothetical protein IT330_01925, partial [Anaerolineae bacterium]|nr:hypothetical protein [Anaerolineae bacterium]